MFLDVSSFFHYGLPVLLPLAVVVVGRSKNIYIYRYIKNKAKTCLRKNNNASIARFGYQPFVDALVGLLGVHNAVGDVVRLLVPGSISPLNGIKPVLRRFETTTKTHVQAVGNPLQRKSVRYIHQWYSAIR